MSAILAFLQSVLSGIINILSSFAFVPRLIGHSAGLFPPELYSFCVGAIVIILCLRIITLIP